MNNFTKSLLAGLGICFAAQGAQAQAVTITGGTATMLASPITHIYSDNAYEIIYRKTQINQAGNVTHLAFEKASGTDLNALDGVKIYFKLTTATLFTTGPVDSTGYTRVFKGAFTNSSASGFQEVTLDRSFAYDNVQNLSMLVIRQGGTNIVTTDPGRTTWLMGTNTQPGICRRYTDQRPLSATSQLLAAQNLVNTRLTFGAATATREDQTVVLGSFPNPTTDRYTVQLTQPSQPATASISDMLGRSVRAAALLPVRNAAAEVNVADLPAGTYLLRVQQNGRFSVHRFVKQ